MKRKTITMLAGLLSVSAFIPFTASACDGACGGANGTGTGAGRRHWTQGQQPGTGEGLNNGVNLSLDQNQQTHNRGKVWENSHKRHNPTNG